MPRFYADENFPLPVVAELRRLGHDVLTMVEADQAGQSVSDERVLASACTEKRAVLTLNRKHFIRLHGVNAEHTGIVVCTFDSDFLGQAGASMKPSAPWRNSMGNSSVSIAGLFKVYTWLPCSY